MGECLKSESRELLTLIDHDFSGGVSNGASL